MPSRDPASSEQYFISKFNQDHATKVAELAEIQAERARIMGDTENKAKWDEVVSLVRWQRIKSAIEIAELGLSEDERVRAEADYERRYAGEAERVAQENLTKGEYESWNGARYISDTEFNAFASEQRRQSENIRGEGRDSEGRDSEGRDGEGREGEGRGGEGRGGEGRGGDFKRVSADGIDFGPGDLGDLPSQAVTLALAAAQKVEIA